MHECRNETHLTGSDPPAKTTQNSIRHNVMFGRPQSSYGSHRSDQPQKQRADERRRDADERKREGIVAVAAQKFSWLYTTGLFRAGLA